MKRTLKVLLAAGLVSVALVGCGKIIDSALESSETEDYTYIGSYSDSYECGTACRMQGYTAGYKWYEGSLSCYCK